MLVSMWSVLLGGNPFGHNAQLGPYICLSNRGTFCARLPHHSLASIFPVLCLLMAMSMLLDFTSITSFVN